MPEEKRHLLDEESRENIRRRSSSVVFLTGAGISVESGIPPFRGKGGLWEKYDLEEVATYEALQRDPEGAWSFFLELKSTIAGAEPNAAHRAIAALERSRENVTIITQNIDDLHRKAGSRNVIELHGNAFWSRCEGCGHTIRDNKTEYDTMPPLCPRCGSILRPDVVFFNEPLDMRKALMAEEASRNAGLFCVVGTSGIVVPAAYYPVLAKTSGAMVVEFNIRRSELSNVADMFIEGSVAQTLPLFLEEIFGVVPDEDN